MSTRQFYRGSLMAAAGVATLGLTACANSHATSPYVGGTHYDYESGQSCGTNCGVGISTVSQLRTAPVYSGTHYDYESGHNCGTNCGASYVSHGSVGGGAVFAPPAPISAPTYSSEVAPCPAGTTSQPDGTCLQNGGSHFTGYSSGTTSYSSGVTSYSSGSHISGSSYSSGSVYSSGGTAECPAGTTAQPDGTCLQSGSSYSSYSSSSSYTPHVSSTYTAPTSIYVDPALTTTECCSVGSTSVYTGTVGTSTHSGYATGGSIYSSSDYLPIRK